MEFPFTVELQPPFSFWTGWFVCGLVLLAAAAVLWSVFRWTLRNRLRDPSSPQIRRPADADMIKIRQRALTELTDLEKEYRDGRISVRETSQRLSGLVRGFVGDVTGIPVQEYTLSDIRRLRMPVLTALVQEYYVPEFADYDETSGRNAGRCGITREAVLQSLFRTRKAIERWR